MIRLLRQIHFNRHYSLVIYYNIDNDYRNVKCDALLIVDTSYNIIYYYNMYIV